MVFKKKPESFGQSNKYNKQNRTPLERAKSFKHSAQDKLKDQPKDPSKNQPQRLQKFLADLGLGSRREIETWISLGRVLINGKPAVLGTKVTSRDEIKLDGRKLSLNVPEVSSSRPKAFPMGSRDKFQADQRNQKSQRTQIAQKPRVILYHKEEGQVCSTVSTEYNESVFLSLPKLSIGRWVMVGRLDVGTSGLLLFTNSGDLAHLLMHPSSNIEREYACRIFGELPEEKIIQMKQGVQDGKDFLKFEEVYYQGGEGRNQWYHVVIKTGKNREVRRLFESQGLQVSRLIRVRFGDLKLPPRLKKRNYIELDLEKDLKFLKK